MTNAKRRLEWRSVLGRKSGWIVGGLMGAWLSLIGVGTMSMVIYDSTSGERAIAPRSWPDTSSLGVRMGRPTMVLFLHPRCPCGKATIAEFEAVARACPEVSAYVVFFQPASGCVDPAWRETEMTRRAGTIPGVRVVFDEGGVETSRFGVSTSGDVLAYDEAGALAFEGGLTAGRGVTGECPARRELVRAMRGGRGIERGGPVYGCAILEAVPQCAGASEDSR
jgi:hypothetical protein